MGDCGICCETYNLKNHTKVECQFCDFSSCRECVQRYILSTTNDPHCMSCKNAWNREYVDLKCTKVFRIRWREKNPLYTQIHVVQ